MKIIESLKRLFRKRRLKTSYLEQVETGELSIIDTSDLNIDRNLTREEDESRKIFLEEVNSGNFSAFISYGNDIAKETNQYMDIIRKRLNQNIEENESFARNVSLEQVIRHKLKIAFNHAEINCIMDSLNELKRNCELRIIALEDLGSIESKKAKRKIPFMSSRIDTNKISSINNTISRLSVNIKIINMLSQSVRNEQKTYFNENNALDAFIRENDESESTRIANKVLNEVFRELKMSINAISTFSNTNPLIIEGKTIDKIDIDKNSLDKKVEIIALAKQYLDLYVAQNKEKVLAPGGLLERAEKYRSELWKEIESDYLDIPLWAKKGLSSVLIQEQESELKKKVNKFHSKYYERIANIEKLIAIFGEEIPDDFKEKFYKTKFYYYALLDETEISDSCHTKPIEINSEEERNYYLKFVSEIVNKIHIESDDSELIKFMNKHLSLKNPNSILDDFSKFVTLLRIEKSGRAGLYTLNLFTTDFEDEPNCCCCLDQINTMNSKKYFSQMSKIPRHNISPIARGILKLWKREEFSRKTYNEFWGDYDAGWNLAEKVNEELYPRSNPSNNSMKYRSNIDYWTFLGNTIQDFNRRIRLDKDKSKENQKRKTDYIKVSFKNEKTEEAEEYKISLAEVICRFSIAIESMLNGKISKLDIKEHILQLENFNIGQENQSYTYTELIKELAKCLFYGKEKELIQTAKDFVSNEDELKDFENELIKIIVNYIINDEKQELNIDLPSYFECSGKDELDIFKKRGLTTESTDFAKLLRGFDIFLPDVKYDDSYITSTIVEFYNSVDKYYVQKAYYNGFFRQFGEHRFWAPPNGYLAGTNELCNIRPLLRFTSITNIPINDGKIKKAYDGLLEVEFGYYPQKEVSENLNEKLKKEYNKGNLKRTGNIYTILSPISKEVKNSLETNMKSLPIGEIEPYTEKTSSIKLLEENEYEGKRYVYIPYGKEKWFEVLPVKWIIDKKSKVMLADQIILSGVPFDNNNNLSNYPYDFKESIIKKFMDNFFVKNLEQSKEVVLLGKQLLYSLLTQKEQAKGQRVEEIER